MKRSILTLTFLFLIIISFSTHNVISPFSPFNFTLRDGTVHNITEYTDKPILLEWGASWCIACEANLKAMDELYPLYKDKVNFISLSFGGSGDDLEDLNSGAYAQADYQWIIGLDTSNKASDIPAANGQMMFMKPDLSVLRLWDYIIIISQAQKDKLKAALDELIVASEGVERATETGINTVGNQVTNAPGFEGIMTLITFLIIGIGLMKRRRRNI